MTDRSQAFMKAIWEQRNNGADTEEKLVAAILKTAAESVRAYNAQNGIVVLDQNDMLTLAEELNA
jgi:hypothetical protein